MIALSVRLLAIKCLLPTDAKSFPLAERIDGCTAKKETQGQVFLCLLRSRVRSNTQTCRCRRTPAVNANAHMQHAKISQKKSWGEKGGMKGLQTRTRAHTYTHAYWHVHAHAWKRAHAINVSKHARSMHASDKHKHTRTNCTRTDLFESFQSIDHTRIDSSFCVSEVSISQSARAGSKA